MDTISSSIHSPASVSLPVSPDDDSRFDRTVSPSPAFPKETLQQCRVSRIIQIHPTLRCNLSCKHCYSSSAPEKKDGLAARDLINTLEQAAHLGYNVVSLSGGEPFIYSELEELVTASRTLGYFNSVTTNGMLLRSQRAARILRHLDLVAISVDGKPEAHDHMRNMPGAFARMMEGVAVARDTVDKFGFIHTLLPDSWQILSWLTDLAIEHKASLLHLHPLELSGRATEYFGGLKWSPVDLYRIYIAHYYLKTFAEPDLFIQLDLLHRDNVIDNPNFFFHQNRMPERSAKGFSTLFKELIINEHGDILPIAHGCSPFFRIGNIHSEEPLGTMIEQFMEDKLGYVMQLYNDTYREILADPGVEIFNWPELAIEKSRLLQPLSQ